MRISDSQRAEAALRDVRAAAAGAAKLEEQVVSGRRVTRPSDDPAGAARIVRLDAALRAVQADADAAALARGDLDAADAALQDLTSVLARARELGVQGASGSLTASDRAALGAEVDALLGQALTLGNSVLDGRALFGGARTDAPPYALTTVAGVSTATYAGSDVERSLPLGPATLVTGRPGPGPFSAQGGTPGALDALVRLRDALLGGGSDPPADARAALADLDEARDATVVALGDVGARRAELSALEDGLSAREVQLETLRSDVRDVDLTTAILDLRERQAAYERGLAVVARILGTSLLDYVGSG